MTALAMRFADEAEKLLGSPFRLHGRDPEAGLDCIGLAVCALERSGIRFVAPSGYALRNLDIVRYLPSVANAGFRPSSGCRKRGDLVLVRPGPSQHHLLVAVGDNDFVHAHAGLRRVALQTGLGDWPLLRHWRLRERSEYPWQP